MHLLLHICCGPCAIYPLQQLLGEGHRVTGLFHNPNIHPFQEFNARRGAAEELARQLQLPMEVDSGYGLRDFLRQVVYKEDERCAVCYRMRLRVTAERARALGADGFSSSLLYSRYQQHDRIRVIGEEEGARAGVALVYRDFRQGWQQGIDESRQRGLYRQQYCGCIYSEEERYDPARRASARTPPQHKEEPMNNIIVLATSNKNKVRELQELLHDFPVRITSLADYGPLPQVVEDGATFDDNAYKKSSHIARVLGLPALADDSGLVVPALGGRPGVYSARYAGEPVNDRANCAKLLQEMAGIEDRRASFECVISLAVPGGAALTWEGRCEGEIAREPRGESGFGYDPVFFYPPLGKTFAEIDLAQKNQVSHRGRAMQELAGEFDKVLVWLRQRLAEAKPAKPDHSQFEHNDWSHERMV